MCVRSWLAFVRLKEGRAELFLSFFPSHVGGAGDGQRCIGNAEKASTRTDGERNPGFFGSSFPPHSLRAFRDLAVLVSGHGILLRRGLALTQTKTNWQMLHRYGSQVSTPSTSSLPLPLSLPNCLLFTPQNSCPKHAKPDLHTDLDCSRTVSLVRSLVRACSLCVSLSRLRVRASARSLSLPLWILSCPKTRRQKKGSKEGKFPFS